jgi:hypothetical protein
MIERCVTMGTHDSHGASTRSPHREAGAAYACDRADVGTELVVETLVATMGDEIKVPVVQGGRKAVRLRRCRRCQPGSGSKRWASPRSGTEIQSGRFCIS